LAALALVTTLLAPELALSVSQYAGVGLLLFVAVAWSLRISAAPSKREQEFGSASTVYRAEQRRTDSRSGRRGSSITDDNAVLAQTAAEESRS
jgi:hypothetical protein